MTSFPIKISLVLCCIFIVTLVTCRTDLCPAQEVIKQSTNSLSHTYHLSHHMIQLENCSFIAILVEAIIRIVLAAFSQQC